MAGVACIFAKWLRYTGYSSAVVSKSTIQHDPFEFLEFYREYGVNSNDNRDLYTIMDSLARKAEIVHIHGIPSLVSHFRNMRKKVVLHCHGSEIVMQTNAVAESNPDALIVSTKNLLEYDKTGKAIWIPNPVDTEIFAPKDVSGSGWLMFKIRYLDMDWITKYLGASFSNVEVYDREANPILYRDMPDFLRRYYGYIDVKYDKNYGHLVKEFSKTALEALACGLPVVNWNKDIVRELSEQHKPENSVKKLIEVYESIV